MAEFSRGQKTKLDALTPETNIYVGLMAQGAGLAFDLSCFGIDAEGKLSDEAYFIFFNQPASPEGSIQMLGAHDGDLAVFNVKLDQVPAKIDKLVFVITIDGTGAMSRLEQGHVRIMAGAEVLRFRFTGADFNAERAVMAGELYRKDGWRFAANGQGFAGGLDALIQHFGGEVADEAPPPAPAAPAYEPPPAQAYQPPPAAPAQPAYQPPPAQPAYQPPPAQPAYDPAAAAAPPGYGAPPGAPPGYDPNQGGYGAPPGAPPGYGPPPGAPPGYDPNQGGYGAPPGAPPGYGPPPGAPPGYDPNQGGYGAPPGAPPAGAPGYGPPPGGPPGGAPPGGPPGGLGIVLTKYEEKPATERFTLQNSKLLKVTLGDPLIAVNGSMVAYQGFIDFGFQSQGGAKRKIAARLTGESLSLMNVSGQGDCFFASEATDLHVLYLEGDAITVNAKNVLAFDTTIRHEIKLMKGPAAMMGGGLSNIELSGTGWVAMTSDGPPVVLQTSGKDTFVDTDAIVAWSVGLKVKIEKSLNAKALIGRGSGEAAQMSFNGQGFVIVQPSEN